MPTVSDYLENVVGGNYQPQTNTWVRLVNNATSTAYVSTAATGGSGIWTANNLLPGIYTVYTGPSSTGPWTVTTNANYQVPPSNLGWYNVLDYGADATGVQNSTTAFTNAISAAVGSALGARVKIPAGTYKLTTAATLPSGGSNSLIIEGDGNTTLLQPTASAFSVSAGYHYDLIFRNFKISGGSNAFSFTTTNQVVRLVLEDIRVDSANVAIQGAAAIVDFTFRRCTFNGCSGDNILATAGVQFNPGLLDTCWFQSGSSTKTSYVNLPAVSSVAHDAWTWLNCIFEGPHANTGDIPLRFGGVSHHNFIGCEWADFALQGTPLPLMQTLAQSGGAPNRMTFIGCNMTNPNGAIINIGNTGSTNLTRWTFQESLLTSKAGTSALTFNNACWGIVFVGCDLNVVQSWSNNSAGTYLNTGEAGVFIPFKQVNSSVTGGGVSTDGLVTTGTSAAGGAGLNVPHGVAPTSPNNGDIWTTTAGMFVRINGVTKTVTLT
jgi:hypothetical protein